jgi:hypothetical protein
MIEICKKEKSTETNRQRQFTAFWLFQPKMQRLPPLEPELLLDVPEEKIIEPIAVVLTKQ